MGLLSDISKKIKTGKAGLPPGLGSDATGGSAGFDAEPDLSYKDDVPPRFSKAMLSSIQKAKSKKSFVNTKKVFVIIALSAFILSGVLLLYIPPLLKKTPVQETAKVVPPAVPDAVDEATKEVAFEAVETVQDQDIVKIEDRQVREAETAEPAVSTAKKQPVPHVLPVMEEILKPYQPAFSEDEKNYFIYTAHEKETKGDLPEALLWYKKAVDIDPEDVRLLNKVGYVLIRIGFYSQAEHYIGRALEIDKNHVPALVNRGIVYANQGQPDKAEKSFDLVLEKDATNVTALYNLMLLYRKQGDYMRALEISAKLNALGFNR